MALALLHRDETDPGGGHFQFAIGSNQFWRFAIGDEGRRQSQGVELLSNPAWISELRGPLPDHAMGRGHFQIPQGVVDREVRFMQLMSYRDEDLTGPAVSPIVTVRPSNPLPDTLPAVNFSLPSASHTAPDPGPMRWREVPQQSEQMAIFTGIGAGIAGLAATLGPLIAQFGPMLLQALPSIAGIAGGISPIIGKLLGSVLPAPQARAANEAGQALGGLSNTQLRTDIAALTEAIQGARNNNEAAPTAVAPPSNTGVAATSSLMHMRAKSRIAQRRGAWQPRRATASTSSRAMIVDGGIVSGAVAGQLLGPLLQQVLTPETVQQVLQMPNQHMQTIFNAMKDAGRLALESAEQDLRHLRELNPGVDDAALDGLLASMSIGLSRPDPGRKWIRAASVSLRLLELKTLPLAGRQISLHARNHALAFPMAVELPVSAEGQSPIIRDAVVQIQVKNAETLAILLTKEISVGDIITSGRLGTSPTITPHETAAFPDAQDVIFCFTLIWKNSRGEPRGAPLQHRGRMAPGLLFDRLEPGAETIQLSDRARFGDYWHKIWGGRFGDKSKSYDIETWYAYAVAPAPTDRHRRLETVESTQPVESSIARMKARLRSGMELSPAALMRLGALVDPSIDALSPQMVAALDTPAFTRALNRTARAQFTFRGSVGDAFEVFAFPVIGLDTGVFRRPGAVDPHGQVLSTEDVRLRIPVPRQMAFRVSSLTGGDDWIAEANVQLNQTQLVAAQSRKKSAKVRRYG